MFNASRTAAGCSPSTGFPYRLGIFYQTTSSMRALHEPADRLAMAVGVFKLASQ